MSVINSQIVGFKHNFRKELSIFFMYAGEMFEIAIMPFRNVIL